MMCGRISSNRNGLLEGRRARSWLRSAVLLGAGLFGASLPAAVAAQAQQGVVADEAALSCTILAIEDLIGE